MNCRVSPEFLRLKKPMETSREFVERALACLRDEHPVLIKLVAAMMDQGITVDSIEAPEIPILEKLIAEANAAAPS